MTVAVANSKRKASLSSAGQKRIIDRWLKIDPDYSEADLGTNLLIPMLDELGVGFENRKTTPSIGIGSGLRPDLLVYTDLTEPPVLAIEIKKRVAALSDIADKDFAAHCQSHVLYREAFGCTNLNRNNNGIRQYLDITKVKPEFLAPYGLIFNGDFFQLWRRVDGLVFPLTPIQKVSKTSIPKLLKQLQKCLQEQPTALVTAVWNMKGGVAKTTNTINIAATLALKGKRVLLIDLDPQGDLSHGIGFTAANLPDYLTPVIKELDLKEFSAASAVLKSEICSRSFPTTEKNSISLFLLSTSKDVLEQFRDSPDVLPIKSFIGMIDLLKPDYDYIFIDAAPTIDRLTRCVLYTCDHVLIPIDGDKAIRHALKIDQQVIPKFRDFRTANQLSYGPFDLGFVRSNWTAGENSSIEKAFDTKIAKHNFSGIQYNTRLKQYAQTEMAALKQIPVISWENSPMTKLYCALVNEVFLSHNFIGQ